MLGLILRYTIRTLRKNAFYHLITVAGLVIVLTSLFYILTWINQEISFDKFHPDSERIYRFTTEFHRGDRHTHFARTWQSWITAMPDYFPEIESMSRIQSMRNSRLKIDEQKFSNSQFFLTDTVYFKFFGFKLLHGDPEKLISEPYSMVLTEWLAQAYFGNEDPIGKPVYAMHQFDTAYHMFTVTGIMEDPPFNSHFKVDLLAPIDYTVEDPGWAYVYLKLAEGARPEDIIDKFSGFLAQFMEEEDIRELTPHLQAVEDIHLHSDKDREIEQNNKIAYIYVFAAVGIVFLTIVLINNANLQVAMINTKMYFIRLNRVNGARMGDIALFTGCESGLLYLLSIVLAILLLWLSHPLFIRFFEYDLQVGSPVIWMQVLLLAVIVSCLGVTVSILPVFFLGVKKRLQFLGGRKALIVLQFSGSVILILLTVFINRQLRFMIHTGIGSEQDNIIVLGDLPRPALDKYTLFKEELLGNPLVKDVSASMEVPSHMLMDAMQFNMEGMDESLEDQFIGVFPVDDNFLDFYDIGLLAGRNFPAYAGMEAREHFIINESALELLGFNNPQEAVGTPFELIFGYPEIFKGGSIIGVAEDFHFYTMTEKIKPMVMFQKHIWFWAFLVKIDQANFSDGLEFVNETWDRLYPDYSFSYHFVDDLYRHSYTQEIRQAKILAVISVLTMVIACLGLLGLMRYLAGARTKEIGIRKVNGASTFQILLLLNRDFIIMVIMALAIGIPVTFLLVRSWLQNFVYRIDVQWWVFAIASLVFLVISILTVSYQSWRAASRNPVKSLRYE